MGFEPMVSAVTGQRIKPDYANEPFYCYAPHIGFKPIPYKLILCYYHINEEYLCLNNVFLYDN